MYAKIKDGYHVDEYVKQNFNRQCRSIIAKLEIEFGRYRGIPREQWYCKMCQSGKVGDEYNFFFHCHAFNNERRVLFVSVSEKYNGFLVKSENERLKLLLSNKCIKDVCNFVTKCILIR